MGDEFYAIIKLTSGEEILSLISIDENEGDPLILLQNPITIKAIHTPNGMHVKVKSWIELSSDDIDEISTTRWISLFLFISSRRQDFYQNRRRVAEDVFPFLWQNSSLSAVFWHFSYQRW